MIFSNWPGSCVYDNWINMQHFLTIITLYISNKVKMSVNSYYVRQLHVLSTWKKPSTFSKWISKTAIIHSYLQQLSWISIFEGNRCVKSEYYTLNGDVPVYNNYFIKCIKRKMKIRINSIQTTIVKCTYQKWESSWVFLFDFNYFIENVRFRLCW